MPRLRADDYETKRQQILDAGAALFAKTGYPSAKMEEIARACGATKSMLYHYFPTKDQLLFAILDEHLDRVISAVEQVMSEGGTAQQRLNAFVTVYTQKSAQSRQRHIVAMYDAKFLPPDQQARLFEGEVKVTNMVTSLLRELSPSLPDELFKPYTMLLIGMLNWIDTWYKPNNRVKPQELCERAARLFLHGFLAEKAVTQDPTEV